MTMTPTQTEYKAGELPSFQVALKNKSSQAVKFCRYKLDYRLKAAMIADGGKGGLDFELQPFVTQSWEKFTPEDIVTLAPGESLEHKLSFHKDPIFGFLRRAKQPPVIPASNAIDGFPAGTYEFNTALSNQVGIYVGRDGMFDRKLEGRKVPDQWPGNMGDCYLNLVEASATVKFR